jgi:pyruvate dehydrogenase E2 component (dihydrolipoamide acetyltransferase)
VYGKQVEKGGGKLTVTSILVKVIALALKKFPNFNASVDMANKQTIYKDYYNIGIAVDTDNGLLVPVIKAADEKNLSDISAEISTHAQHARNKRLSPNDMAGGNFTISNLGGIGGTAFSPIVYAPQVAILGISRAVLEATYVNGALEPRLMMPLSLSYDHRVIDGADGARFLRWVCNALENPLSMFI